METLRCREADVRVLGKYLLGCELTLIRDIAIDTYFDAGMDVVVGSESVEGRIAKSDIGGR